MEEKLSLATDSQQNVNEALDIYCQNAREKRSEESVHMQELELSLETLKGTWRGKVVRTL